MDSWNSSGPLFVALVLGIALCITLCSVSFRWADAFKWATFEVAHLVSFKLSHGLSR